MKKAFILSTLLLASSSSAIILESTALKKLDGIWPAFDGIAILNIVHLKSKYTDMNVGKLNKKTKEREGLYAFKGKKYSIARLVEVEKEFKNDAKAQQELSKILENVKAEFIGLNEEFIKQIQGFKDMVISIMRESCNKRNVAHSFMLSWTDTQAGQETESFKKNMRSFSQLNKFLTDLDGFLKDIYDSCPKGRKQFFDILRKQREQRNNNA